MLDWKILSFCCVIYTKIIDYLEQYFMQLLFDILRCQHTRKWRFVFRANEISTKANLEEFHN